jgi:stage V sporulation protein R
MSIDPTRRDRKRIAEGLHGPARDARELAEKLGLDPVDVSYWIVTHGEMNELIAYDGFGTRYPHWRWGMKYERQEKQSRHGLGKAFEIVINDNPAHAYLQESNSRADQKAVITHVEAHADFFANNRWYGLFRENVDAAAALENHARRIREYMNDSDIGREAVEAWIDHVLTIEDTIDQHGTFEAVTPDSEERERPDASDDSPVAELDLSEEVEREVFDEEWLESYREDEADPEPSTDVLAFLRRHGMAYDEDEERAVEMEEWQRDVLDMLRAEAYYFAPQKMTKVLNEGWAAYWESVMMGEEAFAGPDEFLEYADHQAKVLGSGGLNPYKLGKELWEHVENTTNRREVIETLLAVEGITPANLHDRVDFDRVEERLAPTPPLDAITEETLADLRDLDPTKVDGEALQRALDGEIDVSRHPWKVLSYEGLAERHFSLTKRRNRGYLERIGSDELDEIDRYLFDDARYGTVEEALADVEYAAGWDRMREIRASHNDVTFIDRYLTPEFVREREYFTYEHSHAAGEFRVASTDPDDVKQKLLLQFTNFGKPTIVAADGNYRNRNELLLAHQYNGIMLDTDQARQVLERVFELWGRPVNLKTIVKKLDEREREVARRRGEEPEPDERGLLIRYDGEAFETEDLDPEDVADIDAGDVDYRTKPDDWL